MTELGFHIPSLVVYLVNFLILLGVLYVFAYKRILGVLDQRAQKVKDSLDEAERVRTEATEAQEKVREQLNESRRSNQDMMEQARQAADRFRDEEIAKARSEGEAFLERARQQIQQERDAAVEGIRSHFADLAITAAEQVIERSLDRDAHQDLIQKVLSDPNGNKS